MQPGMAEVIDRVAEVPGVDQAGVANDQNAAGSKLCGQFSQTGKDATAEHDPRPSDGIKRS